MASNASVQSGQLRIERKGTFRREMRRNGSIYLLAIPALLFFLIFNYAPMFGVAIAFKDYRIIDGFFGSNWSGLRNFLFFFQSAYIYQVIRNTLIVNALNISLGLVISVGIAVLLNEVRFKLYKRVSQSMMVFPYFISFIVVSVILYNIFNYKLGIANRIVVALGGEPIAWYRRPFEWLMIYVGAGLWKTAGYGSIIYLASIVSIDPELYESATIDGANRWQQAWRITLPLIRPVIFILLILQVGRIFTTDVGSIYAIIGDNTSLFEYLDTIDLYVFRKLRTDPHLGRTTAAGLIQSVVNLVFVLSANRIVKRFYPEGAVF